MGFAITRATFLSEQGTPWTVEIYDEEETFVVIGTFTVGEKGFEITSQGVEDSGIGAFSSNIDVPFLIENKAQLDLIEEIKNSKDNRYFIRIYKGAIGIQTPLVVFTVGNILGSLINIEYQDFPFFVNLKAIDFQSRIDQYYFEQVVREDFTLVNVGGTADNTLCGDGLEFQSLALYIAAIYGTGTHQLKVFQQDCSVLPPFVAGGIGNLLISGANPVLKFTSGLKYDGETGASVAISTPDAFGFHDYNLIQLNTQGWNEDAGILIFIKQLMRAFCSRIFLSDGAWHMQELWELMKPLQKSSFSSAGGAPINNSYSSDDLIYIGDETQVINGVTFDFLPPIYKVEVEVADGAFSTINETYFSPYINYGDKIQIDLSRLFFIYGRENSFADGLPVQLPGISTSPDLGENLELLNAVGDLAEPYEFIVNYLFESASMPRKRADVRLFSENILTPSNFYEFLSPNVNSRFVANRFKQVANFHEYEVELVEICKREWGWWVDDVNASITNNNSILSEIIKTTSASSFDSGASSNYQILEGYFAISCKLALDSIATDEISFGFCEEADKDDYTGLANGMKYGIRTTFDEEYKAIEGSTTLGTLNERPLLTDVVWMIWDLKYLNFFRNGTLIHREEAVFSFPLRVKTIIKTQNAGIKELKLLCRNVKRQ